jgi:hypothetical protein
MNSREITWTIWAHSRPKPQFSVVVVMEFRRSFRPVGLGCCSRLPVLADIVAANPQHEDKVCWPNLVA